MVEKQTVDVTLAPEQAAVVEHLARSPATEYGCPEDVVADAVAEVTGTAQ